MRSSIKTSSSCRVRLEYGKALILPSNSGSPMVKWLSLHTLNVASEVRTLVGEVFAFSAFGMKMSFLL